MAYETQTKDAILARMLGKVDPSVDTRQGSVVYDMLSPAAIELALNYIELDGLLDKGFADTAFGDYLDRRVAEMGITRKPAESSTGSVTFTGTNGLVIPVGQRVSTDSDTPLYFVTTASGTITGGSVTVTAQAEIPGVSGDVTAGQIKLTIGDIVGVSSVTNAAAFTGGVDEEADEDLLGRYSARIATPSTSGNANHYKQWAKEIPGIKDAKVYPVWAGDGTVKVVLLDDLSTSPDAAKVSEVAAYIEANRPVGAAVTVVAAPEIVINVSATLSLQSGYTLAAVQPVIMQGIVDYLAGLAFVDPIVRYSRISNVLLDTVGVLDYSSLTINGGTSNITVADGSVAVIGTVTLA
jgi:uncharacterized phage protein gp47/JayE